MLPVLPVLPVLRLDQALGFRTVATLIRLEKVMPPGDHEAPPGIVDEVGGPLTKGPQATERLS